LKFQIACPIPFVRFGTIDKHASLPSTFSEYPKISKTHGRFDESDFSVCAFFGADLLTAAEKLSTVRKRSLADVLFSAKHLNLMRYPDPALIIGFYERDCTIEDVSHEKYVCSERNKEFLAPKSHLARIITETVDL